ncbi:hypothetical protein LZG74_25545 [Dyadobacter sp. CY327]|uniref:hypothetical protein n=1 Tax=Dyadobacter sp. CY327 TaxID=2907301 RepID=UPI001F1D27BE|nr:hypothetical protein [Dyadobacter sp. CY327]MCE7073700.1 hypothetical protein [Dyadobacter sp. CY327]
MAKVIIAFLEWLSPMVMAFLLGQKKSELDRADEEKEAAAYIANRLANRPVDRADLVNQLRAKAANKNNPD